MMCPRAGQGQRNNAVVTKAMKRHDVWIIFEDSDAEEEDIDFNVGRPAKMCPRRMQSISSLSTTTSSASSSSSSSSSSRKVRFAQCATEIKFPSYPPVCQEEDSESESDYSSSNASEDFDGDEEGDFITRALSSRPAAPPTPPTPPRKLTSKLSRFLRFYY
jgi:hypothetical protein